MNAQSLWERFQKHLCVCDELGLTLDISRMNFDEVGYLSKMAPSMERAYDAMESLEAGAVANVDEQRMVGHYWLRAPGLAPSSEIAAALRETVNSVKEFSAQVHSGTVLPEKSGRFTDLLLIGIGGSALGPQFLADALGSPTSDRMKIHYLDNTDPDGMELIFRRIGDRLGCTLTLVISKSGGTPETRNGMVVAQTEYEKGGLSFAKHAVAITSVGSKLDQIAERDSWLARFPMWDWVGGRTSVTSAVGLLPAALQGLDIDGLLAGAAACDRATRSRDTLHNPAALLALMWYQATNGRGEKDMVVLPYKDRLLLFSRYLQQLVMESLGKAFDLEGNKVEQGIAVYGNKGSTDQHAYVQQLREGVNNFFVTFIEVLEDGGRPIEVEPGITAGDYLRGLLLGTRQALYENRRETITISLRRLDAFSVGVLIALFERAVGFYASLINVNAYHQPGVEAGKKASAAILDLQRELMDCLSRSDEFLTAKQVAKTLRKRDQIETIFKLLEYLSVNRVEIEKIAGDSPFQSRYGVRRRLPS